MMGRWSMSIPIRPSGGSAGWCMSSSARSSVFVGTRCNPAVTGTQEFPTSGFHARMNRSSPCGRESIPRCPHCAVNALRGLPKNENHPDESRELLHGLRRNFVARCTCIESHIFLAVPLVGACNRAPFFEVTL